MSKKRVYQILLLLYGLVMLWLLFHRTGYVEGVPYRDQLKMNLRPFETIRLFWGLLSHPGFWKDAVVNLLGNVVMFIPLGFLLPRAFSVLDSFWKTILLTAAIITLIELLQLFTLLGSCDLDDLILNILGAAMGCGLHKITS